MRRPPFLQGSPKKICPGQAIHNHRLGCSTNNCDRPNRDLAYAVSLSGKTPSPLGAAGTAAAGEGRHWRNVRGPRSGQFVSEPESDIACLRIRLLQDRPLVCQLISTLQIDDLSTCNSQLTISKQGMAYIRFPFLSFLCLHAIIPWGRMKGQRSR